MVMYLQCKELISINDCSLWNKERSRWNTTIVLVFHVVHLFLNCCPYITILIACDGLDQKA